MAAAEAKVTPAGRAAGVLAGHPSTAARARRFGGTEERPVASDRPPIHAGFSRSGVASASSSASSAGAAATRARRTSTSGAAPSTTGAARSTTPAGRQRQPRSSFQSGSNRLSRGFRGPVPGKGGQQHAVMALFLVSILIVILRSVADYVPDEDQSQPGKVTPLKGLGPLPLAASLCVWYFVLASMAVMRGWPGKIAVGFGGLTTLALLLNSTGELTIVEGWIKNLGAPPSPVVLPTGPGSSTATSTGTSTGGKKTTGGGGGGGSRQAAINAWQAFERAEGKPVTGVISAVEHAGSGTWDIVTSAGDWVVSFLSGGKVDISAVGSKNITGAPK